MSIQTIETPVEAPPAQELNVRVHFRPGFFEPMDMKVWKMDMEINPKTGQHHLVLYDKKGEVFSHDGMSAGIASVEFLDSRLRDAGGKLLEE